MDAFITKCMNEEYSKISQRIRYKDFRHEYETHGTDSVSFPKEQVIVYRSSTRAIIIANYDYMRKDGYTMLLIWGGSPYGKLVFNMDNERTYLTLNSLDELLDTVDGLIDLERE